MNKVVCEEFGLTASLLDDTRRYYRLSARQLTDGLCEESLLSKLIHGKEKRRMDKLLVDALMQRMGRTMRDFEALLLPEEHALFRQRQRLRRSLDELGEGRKGAKEWDDAWEEAEEYERRTKREHKLHRQFALMMKSHLLAFAKAEPGHQRQIVEEALRLTRPGLEKADWGILCYSETELTLAIRLAALEWRTGDEEQAKRHMEQLYTLLGQERYADGEQIHVFAPLLYRLAQCCYDVGEYRRAQQISEAGRQQILKHNKFRYVKELLRLETLSALAEHVGVRDAERFWTQSRAYRFYRLLDGFLKETCPSWNAEEVYPMYREYGCVSLGAVVRQRRELFGMTRETLIQPEEEGGRNARTADRGSPYAPAGRGKGRAEEKEEICSVSTLGRLEREQTATQWSNVCGLLARLRLPPTLCMYDVVVDSYEQMLLWKRAEIEIGRGHAEEARSLIGQVEAGGCFDCPSTRQGLGFVDYLLCYKKQEQSSEKRVRALLGLLQETIPVERMERLDVVHLFPAESEIVRSIAREWSVQGRAEDGIALLRNLLLGYLAGTETNRGQGAEADRDLLWEGILQREEFAHTTALLLLSLEGEIANRGDFDEAGWLLEKALALCVRHDILGLVAYLLYDRAWNLEQETNGCPDGTRYWDDIRTAYVIDELWGNTTHQHKIVRHCEEYFPNSGCLTDLQE